MDNLCSSQDKRALASMTDKFIEVLPLSGYSLKVFDPEGPEFLLAIDASEVEIGQAVLEALNQSRSVDIKTSYKLREACQENYPHRIKRLMKDYGYKTQTALFRNMLSCDIDLEEGTIWISPSHHYRLKSWEGTAHTEALKVQVPLQAPLKDIGAALRLAFSRCTSIF